MADSQRATASLMVDVPYVSLRHWAQFFFPDHALPIGMFHKNTEITADKYSCWMMPARLLDLRD